MLTRPKPEPGDLDRQQHADGGAERGAAGGAQHVGIGQRVAQQALEGDAGDRQAEADDQRRQHPRQPQREHDGLGRVGPGLLHGHSPGGRRGWPRSPPPGRRPCPGPRRPRRRRPGPAAPRGPARPAVVAGPRGNRDGPAHAPAPGPGWSWSGGFAHGRIDREAGQLQLGWMARASEARPWARRGPGRVMGTSSTGRTSPVTTALMSSQPARAATASGQVP